MHKSNKKHYTSILGMPQNQEPYTHTTPASLTCTQLLLWANRTTGHPDSSLLQYIQKALGSTICSFQPVPAKYLENIVKVTMAQI